MKFIAESTCTVFPIRPIDFADPADRERHDRMVALVEQMLALNRRLAAARTEHEQTNLKRQIDAADRRIDCLVYDIYNLTEEEIRIPDHFSLDFTRS